MASGIDLCTVADVRQYSPNVQGGQVDALIADLITSETMAIETYCERPILDRGADIVQVFNGEGSRLIPLPSFPITAVSSVVVEGIAWPLAPNTHSPGYMFDERFLISPLVGFPRGFKNVRVTYRAGYTLATLPATLKQACIELVDLRLQERKRQGVTGRTVGGEQVSYADKDIPDSIKERLRFFNTCVTASL